MAYTPPIMSKEETFITQYPWAEEYAVQQTNIFWTADEINVEKDKHCFLVEMTEAERNAVVEILRLFTLYELKAGSDYWLGRFMRTYKRPELQRMAATFGFFELNVHKPFYAKLNEVLGLATDDFFLNYHNDDLLEKHMNFIVDMIKHPNPLISIAAFSMVEGAILYSSFAFLKHFQSVGKNKLLNVVRGINFSVRDECLAEGTEIFVVGKGWTPIEEVKAGDVIKAYDPETGEIKEETVERTVVSETNEWYEFEGEDFHQEVTPNHRMVTKDGIKLAKDCSEDDEFIVIDAEMVKTPDVQAGTRISKKTSEEAKKFYCVTVPSGAFVVRSKGKVSATGNCIHNLAGGTVFRTHLQELKDSDSISDVDEAGLRASIEKIAENLWNHEKIIIERIFSHGQIDGITEKQVEYFVQSRINMCLRNLGYNNMFEVKYNPIADWFYDGITGFVFNDTFSGIGNSYVRNWDETEFVYENYQKGIEE